MTGADWYLESLVRYDGLRRGGIEGQGGWEKEEPWIEFEILFSIFVKK